MVVGIGLVEAVFGASMCLVDGWAAWALPPERETGLHSFVVGVGLKCLEAYY